MMAENNTENNTDRVKCSEVNETLDIVKIPVTNKEIKNEEKKVEDATSKTKVEVFDGSEQSLNIVKISNPEENGNEQAQPDNPSENKGILEGENNEHCKGEVSVKKIDKVVDDKDTVQNRRLETRSKGDSVEITPQDDKKLNEVLKESREDLNVKSQQKSMEQSEVFKDGNQGSESKENQALASRIDKENSRKESVNSDVNVSSEAEATRLVKDTEVKDLSEKIEERSEVGIVGPPTAVSELINEEELRAESALSADQKIQDHVAEWVHNSVKAEELITGETEEEVNVIQDDNRHRKKNLGNKKTRKKKSNDVLPMATRKSQRVVSNIIKRSIRCLNKMHAMEGAGGNGKKVDAAEKREDDSSRASPKVPQSQQNGAALPEETAAAPTTMDHLRSSSIKKEPLCDSESETTTKALCVEVSQQKGVHSRLKSDMEGGRKRKSTDGQLSSNGNSAPKKFCLEQREQYISSLVGCEKVTAEELAARADQLRAEVQALDELARAKEMEWNEILSMRKLKEEAYLRIERRRQVMGFMEGNGQLVDTLPPASLALGPEWESSGNTTPVSKEKCSFGSKEDLPEESSQDSPAFKKEKNVKPVSHRQSTPPKEGGENGRKQIEAMSPENRQIGEGRQGAIVDVRSIIADYRLRHPETVPRRGRRMRNSVNVGLGAGGAMVETGHNVDSRPSSTDSCKSNPNAVDPNNSMSFKDVLVQFAKLSQQQGEPVKTPQNYPDVTLHPVAPSPASQNAASQQTGSLLHGILTKSQSPRPTTFSPTLARLLTAPERERNAPTASIPQQSAATQHLLQAYQGSNPVSISDLLSSSKARTEITITPVVNTPVQPHSNSNLIHVDDVEEETAVIEDRETRMSSGGRDREDRDSPPRCQGCHERAAQFVCAGCGNQWYCSRECQVAAWDEHSEVCSG